ncbi:MAG: hypothetical protein GY861_02495 [bacterium]|jgi:hypothetical protein|nr:hypothetical protein [bacterium]
MAAYKTLKGQSIRQVAQDPTNPLIGEIWYNTTSGSLKVYRNIGAAISSGGNLNTGRRNLAGTGTQTAGLAIAGGPTSIANVEEYNGTAWSEETDIPQATQQICGAGTQTATAAFGGQVVPPFGDIQAETYEYDGSSWTNGGNMGTGRYNGGGCGTQTAALATGGTTVNPSPPPNFKGRNLTEEYGGTSWTAGGTYPIEVSGVRTAGTQTAALASGGAQAGAWIVSTVNEYDGSSWTAGGSMSQQNDSGGTSGVQTAAIYAGGYGGPAAPTSDVRNRIEIYNGSSWSTETATLTIARSELAASNSGPSTSTMFFGGPSPTGASQLTEEYTDPSFGVQKITTS